MNSNKSRFTQNQSSRIKYFRGVVYKTLLDAILIWSMKPHRPDEIIFVQTNSRSKINIWFAKRTA